MTAAAAYIDQSARLFGDVTLEQGSSVWPFVSIRAEVNSVRIGRFSNIQDFAMIHIGYGSGVDVGDYCSITHRATLHGCTVEDACLIGIGATIMDGCVIGRGSIVAGHSFVREGTIVPPYSIVMGTPAKVVTQRDVMDDNILNALLYHHNAIAYRAGDHRSWSNIDQASVREEAGQISARLREH